MKSIKLLILKIAFKLAKSWKFNIEEIIKADRDKDGYINGIELYKAIKNIFKKRKNKQA